MKYSLKKAEKFIGVNSYEAFVEIMEKIRRHSDTTTVQSTPLFKSQERLVSTKELTDFLLEPSFTIKTEYCRKATKLLDTEKRGLIERDYFTKSYRCYIDYEHEIRQRFSEVIRDLKGLLTQKEIKVLCF